MIKPTIMPPTPATKPPTAIEQFPGSPPPTSTTPPVGGSAGDAGTKGTGTGGAAPVPPMGGATTTSSTPTTKQFRSAVKERMAVSGTTRKAALSGAAAALGGADKLSSAAQARLKRVNKTGGGTVGKGWSKVQAKRNTRRERIIDPLKHEKRKEEMKKAAKTLPAVDNASTI